MQPPPNRPPRDITPTRFFSDWLPREFASEFGAGKRAASDITVAVDLEGEGGGHWVLDVRGGTLSVRGPGDEGPAPMVQLWQSVQDWRALAVGEDGANVDLAPPQASRARRAVRRSGVAADLAGGQAARCASRSPATTSAPGGCS